jgi:hypothetical protein
MSALGVADAYRAGGSPTPGFGLETLLELGLQYLF